MISRNSINWIKTGKNLKLLRSDNISLRRKVCSELNRGKGKCDANCAACKYDMDSNISRTELARVFNVSESVIFNWESGKTPVTLEDMLFYCQLAEVELKEIIVFD